VLSRAKTDYNSLLQHLFWSITLQYGANRVAGTNRASALYLDFWTKIKIQKMKEIYSVLMPKIIVLS
jgi:hypothetical protein